MLVVCSQQDFIPAICFHPSGAFFPPQWSLFSTLVEPFELAHVRSVLTSHSESDWHNEISQVSLKILCYCYNINTNKYLAPYLQFTEINHPPPWVGFKVTFSHNFYSDQYTRVSQMPPKSKSQKIVKSLIWRRLQRRPNLVGFCAAALLLICNGSQLSIQNLNAATFSRKTSQWSYRLSIPNTNLILALLLLLFPMYSNLKFRILNCQFT